MLSNPVPQLRHIHRRDRQQADQRKAKQHPCYQPPQVAALVGREALRKAVGQHRQHEQQTKPPVRQPKGYQPDRRQQHPHQLPRTPRTDWELPAPIKERAVGAAVAAEDDGQPTVKPGGHPMPKGRS